MSRIVWLVAGVFLLQGASDLGAETPGFDQYQVIIDRAPFGGLAGAPGTSPQPSFADNYVFVGIVSENGRVLAVIQPRGNPRAEFKAEGESIGDVTIAKIEPNGDKSKLVLQRGVEKATLSFPPRTGEGAPPLIMQAAMQPVPPAPAPAPSVVNVAPRRRIPFRKGE